MNTKHILIAALLAGAFAPAFADNGGPLQPQMTVVDSGDDNGGPADGPRERIVIDGLEAGQLPEQDHFGGSLMRMGRKAIKNAPYSAEIITEQQQNLADGNQIVNKRSAMSYRDSAGRTRHEVRDASGALRTVTINDTVADITYVLNPDQKSAIKVGPRREIARIAGEKARERIAEMNQEGGERVIVKRIEREGGGELRQRIREDVRIRVNKDLAGGQGPAGMDRIGPVIAGAFGDMRWASKANVKDLGTREIEGIKAQGKSRSYEIPAGEVGNRNPIVVTSETWYAPELQVTVLTRRTDPRTGERSWRMANVKREEPAAALFSVPPDYAVKDVMTRVNRIEKK
jgi:hypothetical protein